MKLVIRELPEYNRSIKSFNDQMSIMKELSLFSKERNLTEIGDFEHLAVSGHNVNGEPEKDKKIMQKAM